MPHGERERIREGERDRASAREGHRKVALTSLLNAQKAMSTPVIMIYVIVRIHQNVSVTRGFKVA